ncbi:ArnT family glycosyltransferase [Candidatus Nitrosarchaeum limnium]|uniref:Putative membrane protein n=1 Tax=Candidatus Nitrosarchaeum limnium BG20 TaxID=859192 RepID=S2ES28_9ARCH|nr:glycosyltransferase family 39 protein [Candidatus Nitrosarchaeum limnium]EPA05224.1 putative membrane protein [Candidatus Nitrosarchaeum limnium BG20]
MEKDEFKINLKAGYLNSKTSSLLLLAIICVVAIVIRLYHTPYDVPIILDGFSGYFLHALDISILGHLPNYQSAHSGWSEFLSLFFMIFHSDNFMDYMNLQRGVSVVLSGITVIPVYFICKKFFNNYYSLIGALIFALDPRIIINSTLGISEPLYIFAITLGIMFFLNSNKKYVYLSFGFFAWATIIRPEGQFWFVAFTIIYFLRFRKSRKDCMLFIIALAVFLLVLSPFVYQRIECCGNDAIVGRIIGEISMYGNHEEISSQDKINTYGPNWINGIKLFGWSIIPIFVILVPIGLIPILKQLRYPNYLLVLAPAVLAIPIMYSVSIAPDTRYVYPLFPIFCVISLFGISWIVEKFSNKKVILSVIVIGIIFGSMTFLEIKK